MIAQLRISAVSRCFALVRGCNPVQQGVPLSRLVSANDWQFHQEGSGTRLARYTELLVKAPAFLA